MRDSAETRWRVTKQDWKHNKEYDELLAAYDEMLERTDKPWAPWTAIHATDRRLVASQVYSVVISALDAALRQKEADAARRKDQDKSAKQAKADAKADAKSDAKSEAKPEAKPAAAPELPHARDRSARIGRQADGDAAAARYRPEARGRRRAVSRRTEGRTAAPGRAA